MAAIQGHNMLKLPYLYAKDRTAMLFHTRGSYFLLLSVALWYLLIIIAY